MFYYVYLLISLAKKGEIYIGSTSDLKRRINEHNKGNEISTKRYLPWRLFYFEAYPEEKNARMREKRLKHNGNAIRELKKRIGVRGLPSTTFTKDNSIKNINSGFLANKLPTNMASKSGAGFTLIELIVIISVSVLLTTMLILYTKTGERQLALFVERSKILGVITQAKTLAIQTLSNTVGDIPCGYGVYFNGTIYFVFKNKASIAGGGVCDQIKAGTDPSLYSLLRDEKIGEEFSLNKGVQFSGSFPQTILFIPPDPTVRLSTSSGGVQTIVIETKDSQAVQAKIKINDFGQITF